MSGHNKHQNIKIRKKFRKNIPYRCCYAKTGNINKVNRGYCCTYPQTYRRQDITFINKCICRDKFEDITLI